MYFLAVLRYIYQNPVKAGLVTNVEKYIWSNYKEYVERSGIADTGFVLGMFNMDREKAVRNFIKYISEANDDVCLEISEKRQVTDEDARNIIKRLCKVNHATDLQKFEINVHAEFIQKLTLS